MILWGQVKQATESNLSPFNLPTVSRCLASELSHMQKPLKGYCAAYWALYRLWKRGHPSLWEASRVKGFRGTDVYFSSCPRAAQCNSATLRASKDTLKAMCESHKKTHTAGIRTSPDEDGNYSPSINFLLLLLEAIISLSRSRITPAVKKKIGTYVCFSWVWQVVQLPMV